MSTLLEIKKFVKSALIGSVEARKLIDPKPHYLPFDPKLLAVTIGKFITNPNVNVDKVYSDISAEMLGTYKYRLHVIGNSFYCGNILIDASNMRQYTPAAVVEGNELIGALYASYANNYKELSSQTFNKIINKHLQKYTKEGTTFDIGHTLINMGGNTIGITPSGLQAINVLDKVNSYSRDGLSYRENMLLNSVGSHILKDLRNFDIHLTYSTDIEISLQKVFGAVNSISANVVIVQESKENREEFGKLERKLVDKLKEELGRLNFSRSLYDEFKFQVFQALDGKKASTSRSMVKIKESVKGSKTKVIRDSSFVTKVPAIRNTSGQFYSLASLQVLLNANLQHVISANMGDGNEKRILNYRTGRFAGSVVVNKLTQSREGMITAYYQFMRNPYGTFSEGGRQQYPKTRDPKLLISRSIAEIAATKISNRMRAVLI